MSRKTNNGNIKKVIVFGDSIIQGLRVRKFNQQVKNGYAKFKSFPGCNSKEMLHYIQPALGQVKKLFVSVWPGFKKRSHLGGRKKIFISYFFRNIAALFYFFFYLDSIRYLYLKWSISIETSSWYICSIFKTRDNLFQYILIPKFITIKDDWTKYRHC